MRRHFSSLLASIFGLLLQAIGTQAAPSQTGDQPGDVYGIRLIQDTASSTNDHSSGSSHDGWEFVERVIALRDGGVELEFDLPADVPSQQRQQAWKFPARVLLASGGTLILLNGAEAEARLKAWLGDKAGALCGHWAFGWTAQYFDCDPKSVLGELKPYLRPGELHEGAAYQEEGTRGPTHLRAVSSDSNRATLVAELEIDPDTIRRQHAARDVAVAEMMHRAPLTLEAALAAHANDRISGTLVVKFETGADARATRRTSVSEIDVESQDGAREHEHTVQTTTWRLVSPAPH